jgi:hypothetical protein
MYRSFAIIALFAITYAVPVQAQAAWSASGSNVTQVQQYSNYIWVDLSPQLPTTCSGRRAEIKSTDTLFAQKFSMVLAAYLSGRPVQIEYTTSCSNNMFPLTRIYLQ